MKLRPATLADVPTLEAWDQQAHVINATGSDDGMYDWATEIPRQVDWREFLIAEIDGRGTFVDRRRGARRLQLAWLPPEDEP